MAKDQAIPQDFGNLERKGTTSASRAAQADNEAMDIARGAKIRVVPLKHICPNPDQGRKHFDPAAMSALTESIAEKGIQNPIVVRKLGNRYEIISGERRYRALCTLAAKGRLDPPRIHVRVLENISDFEARVLAFIENTQRDDYRPIEKAMELGYIRDALTTQDGRAPTLRKLATYVPEGKSTISELLQIYDATRHPEIGELVQSSDITDKSLLLDILRVNDFSTKADILQHASEGADAKALRQIMKQKSKKASPQGRPTKTIVRTPRGADSYDATVRVRKGMGAAAAKEAIAELEQVIADLRRLADDGET